MRIVHWTARLLNYNYTVEHKKGSENVVADMLSRLPLPCSEKMSFEDEVILWVTTCLTKGEMQQATQKDGTLQEVMTYVRTSWPSKWSMSEDVMAFHQVQEELSIAEDLVFFVGKDWLLLEH